MRLSAAQSRFHGPNGRQLVGMRMSNPSEKSCSIEAGLPPSPVDIDAVIVLFLPGGSIPGKHEAVRPWPGGPLSRPGVCATAQTDHPGPDNALRVQQGPFRGVDSTHAEAASPLED